MPEPQAIITIGSKARTAPFLPISLALTTEKHSQLKSEQIMLNYRFAHTAFVIYFRQITTKTLQ